MRLHSAVLSQAYGLYNSGNKWNNKEVNSHPTADGDENQEKHNLRRKKKILHMLATVQHSNKGQDTHQDSKK
jgi:hypothetical protein